MNLAAVLHRQPQSSEGRIIHTDFSGSTPFATFLINPAGECPACVKLHLLTT